MHRKSLEAADQLKDDNTTVSNQSEKEDGDENDEEDEDADEEDDADENRSSSSSGGSRGKVDQVHASEKQTDAVNQKDKEKSAAKVEDQVVERFQNGSPRPPYMTEPPEEMKQRIRQEIQTQMEQRHAAFMHMAANSGADPEEFRNNSIACLRAKAHEHNAKLFSLDALMLMNNNAAAFLHRSSLTGGGGGGVMPGHFDANANNLPSIHSYYPNVGQQQEMVNNDIVTSSDSSPIF